MVSLRVAHKSLHTQLKECHKFAKRCEQISPAQGSLLDDLLKTDLEAIEAQLKALHPAPG